MSTAWSLFITILTIGNIVACLWLLWWTSRDRPAETTEETTGHVWDEDLEELNNPLPRWWLILFYITVVFGFIYLALYPGLGNFEGYLGWTQISQYEEESARIEAQQAETFARFAGLDIPAVAASAEANEIGSRLYANNCSVCHGADARGARGYPNLADDDWLYGGSPDAILHSIRKGRNGVMPALGSALGDQGVAEVAAYVQKLSGQALGPAAAPLAAAGEQKYQMLCTACHGADGKGNQALGAPNLTDDTWLYGGDFETIKTSIRLGRQNAMPAHDELLTDDEIRLIAAYIYSLSNQDGN
ncbi:MAG: cytochrome-c oxidase, cbb3-type subunit III [Gammaproteobacteria bacterium]|nr:cytochrome-c oxidase, cbb3-type subunit III [Gammaproteobacteria bacterium]